MNLFLFFSLGTVIWGTSLALMKLLLSHLSPLEIATYRIILGAIILWIILKLKNLRVEVSLKLLSTCAIFGIFNMALPFVLITFAEQRVATSLGAVINAITPLLTFSLSSIFLKNENYPFYKIVSLLMGFVGICLIYKSSINRDELISIHTLAFLGSSLSYAIAGIYIRQQTLNQDTLVISSVACTISAIFMSGVTFGVEGWNWGVPHNIPEILMLAWLGFMGSGIGLLIYLHLINEWGATHASAVTYLMTITGVYLGIFYLDESLTLSALLGGGVIMLSLVLLNINEYFGSLIKRGMSNATKN